MAHAIGFGELVSQSAIGEPFRAEFKLFGVRSNEGSDCLRLVSTDDNDGIPQLRSGQVSLHTTGKQAFAVVTRRAPVSDPILRVTLEETCSARLRRTYTLLLPMTATAVASAPHEQRATPPAQARAATLSTEALGAPYTLPHAASLNQLARELYPGSRTDRAAFIAALREANNGDRSVRSTRRRLAAGTTLVLPTPGEIADAREAVVARARQARQQQARAEAQRPTAPDAPHEPAPAPAPAAPEPAAPTDTDDADRLVIMGDTPEAAGLTLSTRLGDPSRINTTTAAERDVLRREQQLIMAMDSQIMARLELTDRIARLEALQNALKAELANAAPDGETPPVGAVPPRPEDAVAPLATPAQPAADASTGPTLERPSAAPDGARETPGWLLPAGGALVALIGGLWWWRRRSRADADAEPDTLAHVDADAGEPREADHTDDTPSALPGQSDAFDFSVVEWDGPPPAELDHSIAPIALDEDEMAEEHESAVELADIMMSFGRVQGAAQTLAEFIRGNPRKAVEPWIKLLEVYKAADMRAEFDALTHQLNKTFNVKSVTWDDFDELKHAPDSVEQLPHIVARLTDEWRSVDCQRYLQMLLRDNRGGTREGFPLGVVDDLLMLQAVLEDLLGPYRPSEEEIAAALSSTTDQSAQSREGGFVAPAADGLVPENRVDATPRRPTRQDGANEIIDLDSPATRTYLPDLDFQLDSGALPELDSDFDAAEKKAGGKKKG